MSKRRKNWRERKTPESLAQERWLDAQVERIVVAALTRAIIERTNRFMDSLRYAGPMFGESMLHSGQSWWDADERHAAKPEPQRTCEQGCNGCDECTDYEADDIECPRCHGDGRDPWNDYLLPCPLCLGDTRL